MRFSRQIAFCAATAIAALPVASPGQSQTSFPLSDARNVGPESVRFSAAQFANRAPVVVVFGASTPNWRKARAGIQQAISEGYGVGGVFIGPTDQPPSLEIYAHGQLVTNPINLDRISQAEIAALIRAVWREHYPAKR